MFSGFDIITFSFDFRDSEQNNVINKQCSRPCKREKTGFQLEIGTFFNLGMEAVSPLHLPSGATVIKLYCTHFVKIPNTSFAQKKKIILKWFYRFRGRQFEGYKKRHWHHRVSRPCIKDRNTFGGFARFVLNRRKKLKKIKINLSSNLAPLNYFFYSVLFSRKSQCNIKKKIKRKSQKKIIRCCSIAKHTIMPFHYLKIRQKKNCAADNKGHYVTAPYWTLFSLVLKIRQSLSFRETLSKLNIVDCQLLALFIFRACILFSTAKKSNKGPFYINENRRILFPPFLIKIILMVHNTITLN